MNGVNLRITVLRGGGAREGGDREIKDKILKKNWAVSFDRIKNKIVQSHKQT